MKIIGFVKITGQDPSYHMNLDDGTVIEFSTFARFIEPGARPQCDRRIDEPPRAQGQAQGVGRNRSGDAGLPGEKAGGDETDLLGSTRIHLRRYLLAVEFIDSIEDQPDHAQRRPTVLDGSIAISAADLQMYINKTMGQNLSVKAITSRLAALGAESVRPRSGNFRDQSPLVLAVGRFQA